MTFVDLFVLACVFVGIVSGILTALHPNILYAAISLVFTLLSVAGLYGALGADFLAGVQLAIYVGATVVVILFAIMMSHDIYKSKFKDSVSKLVFPGIVAVGVFVILGYYLNLSKWNVLEKLHRVPVTADMGRALIGPYALPFEYVAMVLLAGLIGAVIVARPALHSPKKEEKR